MAVFYRYMKNSGELTIAQLFRLSLEIICDILLVFDGRAVARG